MIIFSVLVSSHLGEPLQRMFDLRGKNEKPAKIENRKKKKQGCRIYLPRNKYRKKKDSRYLDDMKPLPDSLINVVPI